MTCCQPENAPPRGVCPLDPAEGLYPLDPMFLTPQTINPGTAPESKYHVSFPVNFFTVVAHNLELSNKSKLDPTLRMNLTSLHTVCCQTGLKWFFQREFSIGPIIRLPCFSHFAVRLSQASCHLENGFGVVTHRPRFVCQHLHCVYLTCCYYNLLWAYFPANWEQHTKLQHIKPILSWNIIWRAKM